MSRYQISKEEIKQEIVKCARSPEYFIYNYVKIVHAEKGLLPFHLFDFQKKLLKDFVDHRFNIILKSRQIGISTLSAGYIAWVLNFHKNKSVAVVAISKEIAQNLIQKVKIAFSNMPEWLRSSEVVKDNESTYMLTNGSWVKAISTTTKSGRSEALSLLVVDEGAHIDGMRKIWTGLKPTITTGGSCIILSSPLGTANLFYELYTEAEKGENNFYPTILPWTVHPERDQAWFDNETKDMTPRAIAQEFLCSFLASGRTVIEPEDILRMEKYSSEPIARAGFDRNLWIWKDYEPSCTYFLVGDTSRGDGEDYSAFLVFNVDTMEIVAEYRGKLPIEKFANLIAETGRDYGTCLVVCENNNVGYMTLDKLKDKENYTNLYYSSKNDNDTVDPYYAESYGATPGFYTSVKTRPLVISKMEEFVRTGIVRINSKRMIDEMRTFVWNGQKPMAEKGRHDDLMMCLAIGCWIRDTVYTTNIRESQYKMSALMNMKKVTSSVIPKTFNVSEIAIEKYKKLLGETEEDNTVKKNKVKTLIYIG